MNTDKLNELQEQQTDIYFEMDCPCKGRYLDKMLQPAILNILYESRSHGFSIIQKLEDNSMFDGVAPDKAGVYRYLKRMEESGLLKSDWEFDEDGGKPRRIYEITAHGKECLVNWTVALKNYVRSVGMLIDEIESNITGKR